MLENLKILNNSSSVREVGSEEDWMGLGQLNVLLDRDSVVAAA